jgi:hypothetical protein
LGGSRLEGVRVGLSERGFTGEGSLVAVAVAVGEVTLDRIRVLCRLGVAVAVSEGVFTVFPVEDRVVLEDDLVLEEEEEEESD